MASCSIEGVPVAVLSFGKSTAKKQKSSCQPALRGVRSNQPFIFASASVGHLPVGLALYACLLLHNITSSLKAAQSKCFINLL